ncbi:hypothetical protein VPH35_000154 [Triticum aestivum]
MRNQIKKSADESQAILQTTPVGKGKEAVALRAFIKDQRLRRLSNLVGCRDPEYAEPEMSTSTTPSDPQYDHGAHLEDDTTSTSHMDDEGMVTQEVDDDMTLQNYQVRSSYMLKPRRGINRFTSEDYNNKGKKEAGASSRMASLDDAESDEEEEEPEPVAPPRKEKMPVQRGRGSNKRGRN